MEVVQDWTVKLEQEQERHYAEDLSSRTREVGVQTEAALDNVFQGFSPEQVPRGGGHIL